MARDFPELITVVHEDEGSLTGETRSKVFVKLYIAARESGLIRALGPDLWQTLCVLATRMNRDGLAWPSQALLASDLGIGEKQAQRRMKKLQAFRFHGRPVVAAHSRIRSRDGRWLNNVYELFPVSGFGMFDNPREGEAAAVSTGHRRGVGADSSPHAGGLAPSAPRRSGTADAKHPSSFGFPSFTGAEDRGLDRAPAVRQGAAASSPSPHPASPARRGTNKKTYLNKNTHTVCPAASDDLSALGAELVREFLRRRELPRQAPTTKETAQATWLVAEHGIETARFVLEYALVEAPKTQFAMQRFGAVLGFLEAALHQLSLDEEARCRRSRSDAEESERKLQEQYLEWRDDLLERRYRALETDVRSRAENSARADLLSRFAGKEQLVSPLLVRCRVKEGLAEGEPLPTFEQWLRRCAA